LVPACGKLWITTRNDFEALKEKRQDFEIIIHGAVVKNKSTTGRGRRIGM